MKAFCELDRRAFLAGSAAVVGHGLARPLETFAVAGSAGGGLAGAPEKLMASTFGPLQSSLMAKGDWHPLPKASERAGWQALPADVREMLLKNADAANTGEWPMLLATDELEFKRMGNRSHYEALSFGRRGRLGDLVMGECVAGTGKYLDQIANGVWLICEESFWGVQAHLGAQKAGAGLADVAEPIVELFSAETAATLAWVAYLLGDQLHGVSPLLVPRIVLETKRRVLEPYFLRDDFGWMGFAGRQPVNNWNPWIHSNVLTATLLLEPDAALRAAMVAKVCRSLDRFLEDYSQDGACEEGPGYWGRSAASFYECCRTLVSAHGGKGEPVLTHPFTRAMGHFILDVHIASGSYVNYGDAHVEAAPEPDLLYQFGLATGDKDLSAFGGSEAARRGIKFGSGTGVASLSRELAKAFAVAGVRSVEKRDALGAGAWYPALGLMTAREKAGSAKGFYVAMQAANNGRPHGHCDSGSFIVFHDGEPVFIDVGVGTYTAQTFNAERFGIWTMQSAFHNLPTIGGIGQHDGHAFQARRVRYDGSDSRPSVSADLAAAYPKEAGVTRWMRTLTLDRGTRTVELREEFALAREVRVALSFMTAKEPLAGPEGVSVGGVLLGFDRKQMTATVEKIVLIDAVLRHSWGEAVWRVLLTSAAPVAKGTWKFEMPGGLTYGKKKRILRSAQDDNFEGAKGGPLRSERI